MSDTDPTVIILTEMIADLRTQRRQENPLTAVLDELRVRLRRKDALIHSLEQKIGQLERELYPLRKMPQPDTFLGRPITEAEREQISKDGS